MDNSEENGASNSARDEPTESDLTACDMVDNERERRFCKDLPLAECGAISKKYNDNDHAANKRQAGHKQRAHGAAIFGMVAILAAIVELALGNWPRWPPVHWLDVTLIAIETLALSALTLAIVTDQKYAWLGPRHNAELCRLAKFQFLTTPALWQDRSESQAWISKKLKKEIRQRWREKSLRAEIRVPLPQDPSEFARQPIPPETLTHLLQYYRVKRLVPQKNFLKKAIKDNEDKDRWLGRLAPMLFFAGVFAAGLHLASDLIHQAVERSGARSRVDFHAWALYLALLAACLPAVAAGVRTMRSAFEFQRNRSRYVMAHTALASLQASLDKSLATLRTEPDSVNTELVLKELWWCEHILKIEHYEWLRLMVETEWYG